MPERRRATVKDVAALAQVSTATVSRALNNDPKVLPETQVKVWEAARQLGFTLNDAARSLKTQRTRTIGFVTPELTNGFLMEIAEGIEGDLRSRGYHLLLGHSQGDPAEERAVVDGLVAKGVEGIIVVPCRGSEPPYRPGEWPPVPVVSIDRVWADTGVPAVVTDNEEAAYKAASMVLRDAGKDPVAYLGGPEFVSTARERRQGFIRAWDSAHRAGGAEDGPGAVAGAALQTSGHSAPGGFVEVTEDYTTAGGFRGMERVWEMTGAPDRLTVFVANIYLHLGATEFLLERGVEQGRVRIAAFDYSPIHGLLRYARVFVEQPQAEMGRRAVAALLGEEAIDSDRPLVLENRLVV
jgi:LacI family transcriptional regulator